MNAKEIKSEIDLLINGALPEIKAAFESGNGLLYGQLGEKFGPVAHCVYPNLNASRDLGKCGFFDESTPVMLDIWTVIGRVQSLEKEGKDPSPLTPEFWNHADAVKGLAEYLILAHPVKETMHACTS